MASVATPPDRIGGQGEYDLFDVSAPLSAGAYLADLWRRRQFAVVSPLGELRAQHMNTVLGNFWHLLNPLLLIGVYYLMFGVILNATREGIDNFIGFLAVGIFTFHYSQRTIMAGAKSIIANEGLMRSIQFPRALLPISAVVGQTAAFAPAVVVMVVVALASGEPVRIMWLTLLPIFLLQSLFNLGGAFVVARLSDTYRDLHNVLPYAFRIAFYMSGVLYSVDRFVQDATLRALFDLNPFFAFVSLARGPLLGTPLELTTLASALGWTVLLLLGGFTYFRKAEKRYGRA